MLSTQDMLADDERLILDAIINSATACPTVDGLRPDFDTLDTLTYVETLFALETAGWVTLWAIEGEPTTVTLTPLAAERLGVHLVEGRGGEMCRWSDNAVSIRTRRPRPDSGAKDYALSQVPDGQPTPAELHEAFEQIVMRFRPRRRRDDLPRPTVILMGSEIPWHEYAHADRSGCTTCRECSLDASHLCLRCMRWGLDWLSAAIRRRAETEARKAG